MAGIPRLTVGSSAEEVEYRDELITDILSRVSTRDLVKMSTVVKRWRTLIFEPEFAHTHHKNCHQESIFGYIELFPVPLHVDSFQFRIYNPQTGKIFGVPLSLESIDRFFTDRSKRLLASSNGLLCFCTLENLAKIPEFVVYNPVTKNKRILPRPPLPDSRIMIFPFLVGICRLQSTGKLVVGGFDPIEDDKFTLVFDSQSNSWYEGPALTSSHNYSRPRYSSQHTLFFNGNIYFLVKTPIVDAQEGQQPPVAEDFFRDQDGQFYKIIGYDVNQNRWCFSIFIDTAVGYPYCLFEWEGNLLVLAFNSTGRTRRCRSGHFAFWRLDTEQKLFSRQRELNLSYKFQKSCKVFASSGVVWLAEGNNSVKVYDMKKKHCSPHGLDDAPRWRNLDHIPCVAFEPTLLSF